MYRQNTDFEEWNDEDLTEYLNMCDEIYAREEVRLSIHYADGDCHGASFDDLVSYILSTDCVESIDIISLANEEHDAKVVRTIKIVK